MAHALNQFDAGNRLTVAVGLHLEVRAVHESTPLCSDHDDMLLTFPQLVSLWKLQTTLSLPPLLC
jgi:hypothetical protein